MLCVSDENWQADAVLRSDTYLAKEEKIEESTFVLKDYLSNYAVEYEPLEIEETTAI